MHRVRPGLPAVRCGGLLTGAGYLRPMQDAHHSRPAFLAAPAADPAEAPVPFVDKARLRAGVERHRATGEITPDLAADLMAIARGVFRKARPTDSEDDFAQDCWLHLAMGAPLKRVDPADPRALGFLIRCGHSFAGKQRAKHLRDKQRQFDLIGTAMRVYRPAIRRAAGQEHRFATLHDTESFLAAPMPDDEVAR